MLLQGQCSHMQLASFPQYPCYIKGNNVSDIRNYRSRKRQLSTAQLTEVWNGIRLMVWHNSVRHLIYNMSRLKTYNQSIYFLVSYVVTLKTKEKHQFKCCQVYHLASSLATVSLGQVTKAAECVPDVYVSDAMENALSPTVLNNWNIKMLISTVWRGKSTQRARTG